MKRVILLGIILQAMILPGSFAMNNPGKKIIPGIIKTVEINADVTVVIGHYGNNQVFMDGDPDFKEQIVLKQKGNHLVINSLKNRDLKLKGVIYIPAESLVEVRINSAAWVQSSGTLDVPVLNVLVNGDCHLVIANRGELNVEPSTVYTVEYNKRGMLQPLPIYRPARK